MSDSHDEPVLLDLELETLECQIKLHTAEISSQTIINDAIEKTIEKEKRVLHVARQDLARLEQLQSFEQDSLELLKTTLENYGNEHFRATEKNAPQPPTEVVSEEDELTIQLAEKRKELEQLRTSAESKRLELLISKNRVNAQIRRAQIVLAAETEKRDAAEQKLAELRDELAQFRF